MALVLLNDFIAEADFNGWLDDVQTHLRTRGLMRTTHSVPSSVKAALYVANRTQPELLLRVPPADLLDCTKLIEHLRRLTRPFRFMNLPPELRNSIYDCAIPQAHGSRTNVRLSQVVTGASLTEGQQRVVTGIFELPAIARVSRQMRRESLSLFVATRHLEMCFGFRGDRSSSIQKYIGLWASVAANAYLRQVRRLTLRIGIAAYHFTLSASRGLEVTMSCVSPDSRDRIQIHVEAIEAERNILGLQGESIIMAILRKPELW